jgi:hypothetical protein
MPKYQVLVTGSAYVEVEADNCEDAELKACQKLNVFDMSLDAICEEADKLEETNDE